VDLLEYAVNHQIKIDLLSDQTSCHAPYSGGYCPQGVSYAERSRLLASEQESFVNWLTNPCTGILNLLKSLLIAAAISSIMAIHL
jgi:urocanate hydratase